MEATSVCCCVILDRGEFPDQFSHISFCFYLYDFHGVFWVSIWILMTSAGSDHVISSLPTWMPLISFGGQMAEL